MNDLWLMVCMAPVLSGCIGGGCNPGPSEALCDAAGPASLASLEIVRENGDSYVPVNDYDVFPLVFGSQGAPMLQPYLRMTGSVPGCLGQQISVRTFDDQLIQSDQHPRETFEQSDGSYMTKGIFLIIDTFHRGEFVRMTVTAGGQSVERHIYIDNNTTADAREFPPDTGVPDALRTDATVVDATISDATVSDATVSDATVTDAPPTP